MANIIGIDEAGKGPLAGPVAVGVVKINSKFDQKFFKGIKDSKKLSEKSRDEWFKKLEIEKKNGGIDFAVSLISEKIIDKDGISFAIKLGIKKCLDKLKASTKDQIYLDGGLKASLEFKNQETIIKGDEKIALISLASIAAKVTRDKYMKSLGRKFSNYGFEKHKGYGTKDHIEKIQKYGLTEAHRRSYLRNILNMS